MTNPKTSEDFITFLKEKKVYRQFKEAQASSSTRVEPDIDLYLKACTDSVSIKEIFNNVFLWADTDEGFSFWNELDTEWRTQCRMTNLIQNDKIKSNDPKIVSLTFSMNLGREIHDKLLNADLKQELCVTEKLQQAFPEIYNSWTTSQWGSEIHKLYLKFQTDSIKKVDPKYNNQLWQKIARLIENHIKE